MNIIYLYILISLPQFELLNFQFSNCVLSPAIVFQAPDICRCRTDGPFFEDTTDILNPICSRIY